MISVGEKYYHYKRTWGVNKTYEVVGIARDSDTEETLVLYRPLYIEDKASWDHSATVQEFMNEVWADCCARTLKIREELIERNGKQTRRFTKMEEGDSR